MDIKISGHDYKYDITSLVMMYFPGEKTNYVKKCTSTLRARSLLKIKNNKNVSVTIVSDGTQTVTVTRSSDFCDPKNLVKMTFYLACSRLTGIVSPWGILTGIRPLSVYMKIKANGLQPHIQLSEEYFLSDKKIAMLEKIYHAEKNMLTAEAKDVSLYISIPFCPSKCSYCSFVSVAATGNTEKLISDYLELLNDEIAYKSNIIKKFKLNLKTVYIGGGTPGILNSAQLYTLLEVLKQNFDLFSLQEFTFELGRPETVSKEKLELLKQFGVRRVCINTQTTNDDILALLNRKHNFSDYIHAINIAKEYNFGSINTDLIAGLPGETLSSFKKSVDDVICMGVDNITIHTLAIKKSSNLSNNMENYSPINNTVSNMLEYAYDQLMANGYMPYYIYRQKNCVSNGENIGFCKPDKICRYNVYMMEDVHTVLACGAGASSKIIDGTIVDRFINVKYPMEYVRENDKIKLNSERIINKLKEIF